MMEHVLRTWGSYDVLFTLNTKDDYNCKTKIINIYEGENISYQKHNYRNEIWTVIDGKGEVILDGVRKNIKRGDNVVITCGTLHSVRAITPLTIVEVQHGEKTDEDDIERFEYDWGKIIDKVL